MKSTKEIIDESAILFICYRCNYIFSSSWMYINHKCALDVFNCGELNGWVQRQQRGNKR